MKRIITLSLIIMVLFAAMALTSCFGNGGENTTTTTTPTTTQPKPVEPAPPVHEHDFNINVVVPTCESDGYTEYVCKSCGYVMQDSFIEADPIFHMYETSDWVNPSCYKDGYYIEECKYCHDRLDPVILYACHNLNTPAVVIVPATCTTYGVAREYCSDCGYYEDHDIAPSHNWEYTETSEPTCTEHGYDVYTCSDCGSQMKEINAFNLEHVFGEWTDDASATCSHPGKQVRTCERCGVNEYKFSGSGDHNYNTQVIAPTCTAFGYTIYTCGICGDSFNSDYVAPAHTWGEWEITVSPTCNNHGLRERSCACGATETEIVDPEHSFTVEVTAPTCVDGGYSTYTCADCLRSFIDDYVPATGHTYGDWVEIDAPKCTEEGLEKRECACGDYETRVIDPTGHTYGDWYLVEGYTCTEDGEEKRDCANCDHFETNLLPATGHDMGDWVTIDAPTCLREGLEGSTCETCGYFEENVLGQINHNVEEHVVVIAPTEYSSGYTKHSCDCGMYSYIDAYISAPGSAGLKFATATRFDKELGEYVTCESVYGIRTANNYVIAIPMVHDGKLVEHIQAGAFMDYDETHTVYIPISIKEIGTGAFANCNNIKRFVYCGTMTQWNAIVKGESWDLGIEDYVVECVNGTIYMD